MVAQFDPTVLDFRPTASVLASNIELEEALLGSILFEQGILEAEVVRNLPTAAFSIRPHRLIFREIIELHKAGLKPDTLTLQSRLSQSGLLEEIGGRSKLAQLLDRQAVLPVMAVQYAEILNSQYQRQYLSNSLNRVAEQVGSGGDLNSAIAAALEQLAQFSGESNGQAPLGHRVNKKLTLEDAAELVRGILQAKHTELIENIELEKVREACGMSSYDWERKIVKPIKRDLNAERFKFDLLNLLAIEDEVERIRQQAELAPKYQMSAGTIERALLLIKQRTSTPETQWFGLDDFFDLESFGLKWIIPELLPTGETIILALSTQVRENFVSYRCCLLCSHW